MKIEVILEDVLDCDLTAAAKLSGVSREEFVKAAVRAAIVSGDPDRQIPIQAIRQDTSDYAKARGPFLIMGLARSTPRVGAGNFSEPMALTVSNLEKLQKEGAVMVSVRFTVDKVMREPDFTIEQLLRR